MIDISKLSGAIEGESPSGPDLESDPQTFELDVALRAKSAEPDAVAGDAVDWNDVRSKAIALLERSRDLRVAAKLAEALLMTEGLGGLADAMDLIERLCRDQWASVYPLLDADDDDDPTMRCNALASLSHFEGLPRLFRNAPWLTIPGFGLITLRDVEVALGVFTLPEGVAATLAESQAQAMLASEIDKGLADHASQARDRILALSSLLTEKVGSQAPDLRPLVARLKPFAELYARARAASGSPGNAAAAGSDPDASGGARSAGAGPTGTRATVAAAPGAIDSRESAIAALERVCRYIEQSEPANPAPLLIRRAQKLIRMNFVDIIRELAPEGMDSIIKIAGIKESDQ